MCWKCGKGIALDGPVGRTLTCAACGADVRSCKNCGFFSPGSYHDCAERVDEAVRDKARANFCDSFRLNAAYRSDHPVSGKATGSASSSGKSDSRADFDSLFNSKGSVPFYHG